MKNRIEYFDFLRGVAIIGVIAIHTYGGLSDNLSVFTRQIFNCSVPIFLAISGYFLANKDISSADKYFDFLKKQIPRVYLPMLLWSIPYLMLSLANGQDIFKSIAYFFTGGYSIYYFVALILQFYILLPVFKRFVKMGGIVVSMLITLGTMSILFYTNHVIGLNLPLIIYAAPFPVWMVFFVVGLFVGKRESSFKPNIVISGIMVIVGLLLSFVETLYISQMKGFLAGAGIKGSATLYSLGILFLMFSLTSFYRSNKFTQLISQLGTLSFGIYLSHMFVILFVGKIYPVFFEQPWILKVCIILAISYIGCFVGYKIHPTLSKRYLGIG